MAAPVPSMRGAGLNVGSGLAVNHPDTRNTFGLVADLEAAGAIGPLGLTLPADMPWERYEALCRFFGVVDRTSKWAVGDLQLFGEEMFGEDAAQALAATGLSRHTLENRRWVCSRIAASRRREAVSFSAHSEVAALEPADQDVWLDRCEAGGWTVETLRCELREAGFRAAPMQPQWTPAVVDLACRVLDDLHLDAEGGGFLSPPMVDELTRIAGR